MLFANLFHRKVAMIVHSQVPELQFAMQHASDSDVTKIIDRAIVGKAVIGKLDHYLSVDRSCQLIPDLKKLKLMPYILF